MAGSTITPIAQSTFKVGTYNAVTDTFTSVINLNDKVSYWLVSVKFDQPKKVYSRASTIRAQNERIVAWNYQNRHIKLTINLVYGASSTALLNSLRTLVQTIENPPYRLAFAAPNTSILTYADVVAVTHNIPYDGKLILNGAVKAITIDFEVEPGFKGDRLYASNLVFNPGFEAASGPAVTTFTDNFANINAYSGSSLTLASNVMSIPSGSRATFGSPSWGAINHWQVRFQAATGMTAYFYLHVNGSTLLRFAVTLSSLAAQQYDGTTLHSLATSSPTLTNGTFYWIVATQYPGLPGQTAVIQATLYADSSGAIGSPLSNGAVGPVATFDAVSALTGQSAIEASGATVKVGGAFTGVHVLQLFGPSAWASSDFLPNNTYTPASYAWDQSTANTYTGGPFTSYGAARIDIPPAGFYNASWDMGSFASLALLQQTAIPVAAGSDVLGWSLAYKASGFAGANAIIQANLVWYTSAGASISTTFNTIHTGSTSGWATASGTATAPPNAAFAVLSLNVSNTTTQGQDAGATLWFDNAQVYDQTALGQTSMPYCEQRFFQSPSQIMLSGIVGDMLAPANLAMALYEGATPPASAVWWLGSQANPRPDAQFVFAGSGSALGANLFPVLSSASYYGFYFTETIGAGVANITAYAQGAAATEKTLAGSYHIFGRFKTGDTHYTSQFINSQVYESPTGTFTGTFVGITTTPQAPLGASNANWTWGDMGIVTLPVAPQIATEDLTQKWITCEVLTNITTTPNGHWSWDSIAYLPVDGDLVSAALNMHDANLWFWVYNTPDTAYLSAPGWRYSETTTALPNTAAAAGGLTSGANGRTIPLSSSYLRLDPTQKTGLDGSSIAVMTSIFADTTNGNNFGCVYEISYVPQYLWPRTS